MAAMSELEIDAEMWEHYSDPRDRWDWRQMSMIQLGDVAGKTLLDYGCGIGEESVYFAKLGAAVTAVDNDVEMLRRRAKHHQLDIEAIELRAARTPCADNSFERVHGFGILERLGIEPALAEVHRVLAPGGVGVFLELMGDNPYVAKVKTWLRHGTTAHLTWDGIAEATRRFSRIDTVPYWMLSRMRKRLPRFTHEALGRIDHRLFELVPRLHTFAGAVVIRVVK